MKCKVCKAEAEVALKSHNAAFCRKCYLDFFRRQLERGIKSASLFAKNDKILVALSGGKDSLSLMLELAELGYNVAGLFIDLAIPESSLAARQKVEEFCNLHKLRLRVINLKEEGLAIPEIKKVSYRPICSVCGQIKRYYFNRLCLEGGYDVLATGHNLDDEVGRLFNNTLRWDAAYLASQGPLLPAAPGFARKVKPLWRLTEFETANYAFIRGIEHHRAPCPYSAGASFSILKDLMNQLNNVMPGRKLDFYQGFLERGKKAFASVEKTGLNTCPVCGMATSAAGECGVCRLKTQVALKT